MKLCSRKNLVKLTFVLALAGTLIACQPSNERLVHVTPGGSQPDTSSQSGSVTTGGGGERKLAIVQGSSRGPGQELTVSRIHRLEGANIEGWLSENELKITTTKLLKAGTDTKEAIYGYSQSVVDLTTDQQRDNSEWSKSVPEALSAKEAVSPDGKFSFVQKWRDKYTADNFLKDLSTGKIVQIKGANYMEMGGWLDNDAYVLAAGSTEGRGDLRKISTDGTVTNLTLNDPETEIFTRFRVNQGRIYYTDNRNNLKVFKPEETHPRILVEGVWDFDVSPDGERIAVSTASKQEKPGTNLLIYNSSGSQQGFLAGKGDMVPYLVWSPDSSRLAFAVYTEDKSGMNGVYIFNSESGKVLPLGPAYYPQYPLNWNPSGTRLGITFQEQADLLVTMIYDFQ